MIYSDHRSTVWINIDLHPHGSAEIPEMNFAATNFGVLKRLCKDGAESRMEAKTAWKALEGRLWSNHVMLRCMQPQNSDAVTLSQNGGKPFRDPSTCTHTHIPCAACASNEKFCVCEIQFPRGFLPCGCLLLDYLLFYFRHRVDQT